MARASCAAGQDKIRPLWKHYYDNTDALVWIVDSCDADRMAEARDAMHHVLSDDGLRGACVLVLANKQDLPQAMRVDAIADKLGLNSYRRHEWYIQPCSAVKGDGILDGLDWLHKALNGKTSKQAMMRGA